MKLLVVVSAILAVGYAKPSGVLAPLAYAAAPIAIAPIAVSSQYHAQDTLGQYTYGYASGLASKAETRTFDGVTHGGYSYVDAAGQVQRVAYAADAVNGFRVAATNLPVAPVAPAPAPLNPPAPVQDTPEVVAARAQHLAAVEAAAAAAAESPAEPAEPAEPAPAAEAAQPADAPAPAAAPAPAPATPADTSVAAAPAAVTVAAAPAAISVQGAAVLAPAAFRSYAYGVNAIHATPIVGYSGFAAYGAPYYTSYAVPTTVLRAAPAEHNQWASD